MCLCVWLALVLVVNCVDKLLAHENEISELCTIYLLSFTRSFVLFVEMILREERKRSHKNLKNRWMDVYVVNRDRERKKEENVMNEQN